MAADARIKPGGGIAKAFAEVVAPGEGEVWREVGDESRFSGFSGPTELATGVQFQFLAEKVLVRSALWVPKANPSKMKQFVGKDTSQLVWTAGKLAIQNNLTLANVAAGVYGLTARTAGIELSAANGQRGQETDADRSSLERRQTFANPFNGPAGAAAARGV